MLTFRFWFILACCGGFCGFAFCVFWVCLFGVCGAVFGWVCVILRCALVVSVPFCLYEGDCEFAYRLLVLCCFGFALWFVC